jgi:PAS domain S-box-containing protein
MAYHLKTRIAIAVSLLILVFMVLLGGLGLSYFEEKFKAATYSHFADSLSVTSNGISSRIEHALYTLEIIKETIPHHILNDPTEMQAFLEKQNTDLLTFDNGLVLFGPDGRLLAVNPRQNDVLGMDFSFRDYIKITLQTRQPYISAPFKSRQQHHHPIIMLTEPILNDNNEVIAILGGSFDLYGNNFLHSLINRKIGDAGYYLMIDQEETLVIHPERKNILSSADKFFPRKHMVDFLTTSRGPITKVTMGGQEMIGAFQHVSPLNWTLIALSPLAENFQPMHQARTYLIFALVIFAAITVLVVRLLTERLTSPLIELTEKVRLQTQRQDEFMSIEAGEYEELGDLASSIKLLMSDVSLKRKATKDQLAFLQNLIDTIPGPIFYKDKEYNYMGCNRAFEEYIGIPREELVGKSVFDIAPPNLAKVYHQADIDLWDSGGNQQYEAAVKYADGSMHDVIYYKKVFSDVNGEPAGMIGTFLDITDRKRSEQAMIASEKHFRLLVENAADAFFLHDEEGQILDVNQQACSSLGYTREELLAMKVPDISVDFNLAAVRDLQVQMENGEKITVQGRHRRKDGKLLPVEVRLCHTEQEGGVVIALARDISDRKRDEESLQQALHDAQLAKQQVDNIIQSAADGLVVTNQRNRVTHINQIAEEMLGICAEEVMGQVFTKLFIDSQLREQVKTFLTASDLESRQLDFKLNLSGARFPRIVQARSSMLRNKSGERAGVVTLLHDVSRERELDQIKSEFISTAAHEMRTPMSVIMGYIEMLLDSEQFGHFSAERQKEFLGEAYRKGEALSQIVDDLFDISRIEAGLPLPIERAECDLNKVVREVVQHYERHITKHKFKTDLDGEARVHVDGNKMAQVFENLISNAVKYSPDGGEIVVRSVLQDKLLRIVIEDQGSGMSSEQLERVFDKFYRADSSNTAVSGLGLGMSIVKAIIEGHDGRIWVESTIDKGTCVSVEIPCEGTGLS